MKQDSKNLMSYVHKKSIIKGILCDLKQATRPQSVKLLFDVFQSLPEVGERKNIQNICESKRNFLPFFVVVLQLCRKKTLAIKLK